jgi:transcription initiation factor IIE alpha subunit
MKRNRLNREEILTTLFQKIQAASHQFLAEEILEEDLPTAASLARELDLRLDEVKKRLTTLREEDLVQSIGVNPKRYRINVWRLKALEKVDDYPFAYILYPPITEEDED